MEKSEAVLHLGEKKTAMSKEYSYNIASGIISCSTVNKRDGSALLDFFHNLGVEVLLLIGLFSEKRQKF